MLDKGEVRVVIDPFYIEETAEKTLYLRPQTLVLGVGCKKDMAPERMAGAFQAFARKISSGYTVYPGCGYSGQKSRGGGDSCSG